MKRRERVAALGGLGAGAAAVGLAGVLLHRTWAVAQEISRYATDIATAAGGVQRNTDLSAQFGNLRAGTARIRAAAGASAAEDAVP